MPKKSVRKNKKSRGRKHSKHNMYALVSAPNGRILPERYRTKMSMAVTATIAPGFLPGAGAYFVSYANSAYQPFSGAPTFSGSFTATQGSSIANNPVGFALLSTLYQRYRVNKVTYKLTGQIGSNSDTMTMFMYPFVWSGGVAGLNPFNAAGQPGYVQKVVNQATNSSIAGTIKKSYNVRKYLGYTKTQYDSQPDSVVTAIPNINMLLGVNFGFEPLNSTANSQAVSIFLEAIYDIEWSFPTNLIN